MISLSDLGQMTGAQAERARRRSILGAICVVILIAYFLHFALGSLRGGFREDEMMNMGIYWRAGALKSLLANAVFWKPFYCSGDALYYLPLYLHRPGGALYYLPLYHFFALNPLPYRVVQISILAASIPIVYYLSDRLAGSRSVAFLAVLAFSYRPRLANLAFVGSFIYDVLCGFFYFAALAYYVHIRERNMSLRPRQLLAFLALYVCALNCKEMAVTLPVIILIYEVLKAHCPANWKEVFRWFSSFAKPSLIAGLLTLLYIYGKTHGRGSLAILDPYRPRYSWHNFVTSNAKFVAELLFAGHEIKPVTLLLLWTGVFTYAFLRRDRMLKLMAFWVVIVPLPIAFILPFRGDAPLYLVLFGWAMIFAKAVSDLITLISKPVKFIGKALGAGTRQRQMLARVFPVITSVLVAAAFAIFTQREHTRLGVPKLNVGANTSNLIQVFRSLNIRPTPGSSVLLLPTDSFFQNKWNVLFLASLVWNDHSLRLWVEDAPHLTRQQLENVDYVISLSEFRGRIIRSPEAR